MYSQWVPKEDLQGEEVGRLGKIMICFHNTCYLVKDFRKLHLDKKISPLFLKNVSRGSQRDSEFAKSVKILEKSWFSIRSSNSYRAFTVCQAKHLPSGSSDSRRRPVTQTDKHVHECQVATEATGRRRLWQGGQKTWHLSRDGKAAQATAFSGEIPEVLPKYHFFHEDFVYSSQKFSILSLALTRNCFMSCSFCVIFPKSKVFFTYSFL